MPGFSVTVLRVPEEHIHCMPVLQVGRTQALSCLRPAHHPYQWLDYTTDAPAWIPSMLACTESAEKDARL
jgi:hypothetical protein